MTCPPAITAAKALASLQPRPPAGFTESVMARVRAELRRSRHFSLPAEPPATLLIAERPWPRSCPPRPSPSPA